MMNLSKKTWIDKFQDQLIQDNINTNYYNQTILLSPIYNKYDIITNSYLSYVNNDTNSNQGFCLLDLYGRLKYSMKKNRYLDVALADVLQKYNLSLVADNEQLSKLNIPYRVVILDATEDYLLNYYPQIHHVCTTDYESKQKTELSDIYKKILKNPLRCICFVDDITDNMNCFLALVLSDNNKTKTSSIPVINTTCDKINKILHSFNLYKKDHVHQVYFSKYFDDDNCYANDKNFASLKQFCLNKQHSLVDALSKNITASFDNQGELRFKYPNSNLFWQKTLHQYDQITNDFTCNTYYNIIDKTIDILINQKVAQLPLHFNTHSTTVKSITFAPVKKHNALVIKPLIKAKGLNKVLATLQLNNRHPYYLTAIKNQYKLISLYGDSNINIMKIGYYEK